MPQQKGLGGSEKQCTKDKVNERERERERKKEKKKKKSGSSGVCGINENWSEIAIGAKICSKPYTLLNVRTSGVRVQVDTN